MEEVSETVEVTVLQSEVMDTAALFSREMLMYEAALDLMMTRLEILTKEFSLSGDRSPIDNLQSRIKSPQSIMEKLQRKGLSVTLENMEREILDIAGIRIVCPFLEDVYRMADILQQRDDMQLVQIKDYIKNPKPSGYRSLHMIVTVEVRLSNRSHRVPVELQLRTIAMNCWASTEHQLRYKKDRELPQHISEELKECAEVMYMIDRKVQRLADEAFGTNAFPAQMGEDGQTT